jgi:hypothetical protein
VRSKKTRDLIRDKSHGGPNDWQLVARNMYQDLDLGRKRLVVINGAIATVAMGFEANRRLLVAFAPSFLRTLSPGYSDCTDDQIDPTAVAGALGTVVPSLRPQEPLPR